MTSGTSGNVAFWRARAKRLARRLILHSQRHRVRALYNRTTWRLYAGNKVTCNCCGGRFRRFRIYTSDGGHRSLMCPRCGSLGRHRVDWLYLTEANVLDHPTRLLHIAPEVCLETPLRKLPTVSYLSADYDSTLAMERVDVTDIHYGDDSFDAVICNHVLQLVEDDRAAMRELHRVIAPGGWALMQSSVDTSREDTIEKPQSTEGQRSETPGDGNSDERYEEVFMRLYGRDYADRLREAGFSVTVTDFAKGLPTDVQGELGLDLAETIFFCRKDRSREGVATSGSGPR